MGDWSLLGDGQYAESATQATNPSLGIIVESAGSANTKGSWTELISSTSHDGSWLHVMIVPNTSDSWLIDIGVGAAGSEKVLVPNLFFVRSGSLNYAQHVLLPIMVPAGTRLSARCQSVSTTQDCGVVVNVYGQGFIPSSPLQRVTAYGAVTGSTTGTAVDPGSSASTRGSWVEISSSTTNPIRFLLIAASHTTSTAISEWWMLDIGVGGAGSEKVIVPNLMFVRQPSGAVVGPITPGMTPPIPVSVPAGSRLSARGIYFNTTSSPARVLQVVLYGVD